MENKYSDIAKKIKEFEEKHDLTLPPRYKQFCHLTCDFWSNYDDTFYIADGVTRIMRACLCDPLSVGDCDCGVDEDKLPEETFTPEQLENMGFHENIFTCVRDWGCTSQSYLCIKGTRWGEIWDNVGGGDYLEQSGSNDNNYNYNYNC